MDTEYQWRQDENGQWYFLASDANWSHEPECLTAPLRTETPSYYTSKESRAKDAKKILDEVDEVDEGLRPKQGSSSKRGSRKNADDPKAKRKTSGSQYTRPLVAEPIVRPIQPRQRSAVAASDLEFNYPSGSRVGKEGKSIGRSNKPSAPSSFNAKSQSETVGLATEPQQSNIPPSPTKQPGVAGNVAPFNPLDSGLSLAKVDVTSAEPHAVAAQDPRQSPPSNNELDRLMRETDKHILDRGTRPTEAGDDGWIHESWEETHSNKQLADLEYTIQHTSWIVLAIGNSFQRGVEFVSGSQLSWWPLPDPEEEPRRGFTRVYSLRSTTRLWKTRRFYDDIPTPSAEKMFPTLTAAIRSSEGSRWAALGRIDIVLQNTTLMHVLQHFENRKRGNSQNQTPRSMGMDAAVHDDKRGKDVQETRNRDEKGQELQHPFDESDQHDSGSDPPKSGTILYVTADTTANESVACTVNLGEDDKKTLSNLYKTFRALRSGRWKRATGMKFYRSGEAWYFFNNPDECCTSTQLNRSLLIRFEDTAESRFVA
ncbi:cyclin-dependent protein kinase complex component [Colletotrichum plurivorum]|uniref:Cyclin-dependent protein kinase complex component n=1 Tax=Colletotrichum plurivorum TaxID=2175906 RepID=A0A8H6N9I6_9PEZI|nr:cyclin-dependent protein kinase complex component [Colletotrichum plurivorum]